MSVCETLMPGPPHGTAKQVGNGGYIVSVPSSLPRVYNGPGFAYRPGESHYGEENHRYQRVFDK